MILDKLIDASQQRAAARRQARPLKELENLLDECPAPLGFVTSLAGAEGIGLIAELKPASPSAGVLRQPFPAAQLATELVAGGADCLSVLTESDHFQGSLENLELAAVAAVPRLQKDFVLSEYQVLEGRVGGADAVLLIAEALDPERAAQLCSFALSLGMDVLYEAHSAAALRQVVALAETAPQRILVGINNRDLQTFQVDLATTTRALDWLPAGLHVVGESGIHNAEDVRRMRDAGACAILVGETLMRQAALTAAVQQLMQEVRTNQRHGE